jgi:hypothetical protein
VRLAGSTFLLKGYNRKELNISTFKRKTTIVRSFAISTSKRS